MMYTVNLDREDIMNLVLSVQPDGYQAAEDASKKGWGNLDGFPNERWSWNRERLKNIMEPSLLELYYSIKTKGIVP